MRTMTLGDRMEFDHVIEVHPDGTITDRPDVYAPELIGEDVWSGWELLNGFSGQDRYSGPIMHQSELIGGGLERYILETPGVYVALVSQCDHSDPELCEGDTPEDCQGVDGWAIAVQVTR